MRAVQGCVEEPPIATLRARCPWNGRLQTPAAAAQGVAHTSLLTLLAGHAGIVLENHLLDERRTETTGTTALRAGK